MRRIAFILIAIFSLLPSAFSQRRFWIHPRIAPSAASYLLTENCEGTGTPAGWTDSAGAPNWDNTTNVLAGSQSLALGTLGDRTDTPTFANTSPCYLFFAIKVNVAPANNTTIMALRNQPVTTTLMGLEHRTSGALNLISNDGNQAAAFFTPTAGTLYYIWLDYTKGSGANGVCNAYHATTTTKPGSPDATISNSGSTADAGNLRLLASDSSYVVYDYIRVSASSIGDAPP